MAQADPEEPAAESALRPGRVAYLVTTIAAAGFLYAASFPSVDGFGQLKLYLIAVLVAPLALSWAVFSVVDLSDSRSGVTRVVFARWLCVPVVLVLVGIASALGFPRAVRIDFSRSSMNQAADRLEAGQTYGAGWIGLYPIDRGAMSSIGPVLYVRGLRTEFGTACGLARVRSAPSAAFWLAEDEGEGWWIVCPRGSG